MNPNLIDAFSRLSTSDSGSSISSSDSLRSIASTSTMVGIEKKKMKVKLKKRPLSPIDPNRLQSIMPEEAPVIPSPPILVIQNRGTGAGGSGTNKTGLPYEELTDLKTHYKIMSESSFHKDIIFDGHERVVTTTKQANFFKHMSIYIDKSIHKAHGCKNPDECFIEKDKKIIFFLEKKFQQVSGSVCENTNP